MGTRMNLKTSFVLHFFPCPYRLSTKDNLWLWAVREGVYRCSLGQVFSVITHWPRLVFTRHHIAVTLLFGYQHTCWPMPRHDCWRSFRTQTYDGTSKIPWKLPRKLHFPLMRTRTLQAKVMSSVEESSLVKTKHIPFLGSTREPSPEPRTPKEQVIHRSEFPIEFRDYGNTLKYHGHEKLTLPSKEDSPRVNPSKEWLMEVKRSSKVI